MNGKVIKKPKMVGRSPSRIARTIGGMGSEGDFYRKMVHVRVSDQDKDEWENECLRCEVKGAKRSGGMWGLQYSKMDGV